ncbi:NAD(P)H-binding protein [Haloechinothrix sp. LS1_15]|uniref:NAD(P)H-binding protein n=1 Tax=Haloechinothrix sp. LS1_15 TaxID=2652248 RepID=UPI002944B855|nr:NAD(P)H-binding protein [Haloechinothrix sp. LS1_15]MDV6012118.1 NAD(P)H-binding protein [Haloechinothrix sp. LS1_15]
MTILVTGATGNIGRRVVDRLVAAGATDVRALTTNPAKAALPDEVEVVRGYVGKPETVPPALEGVERMYLAPVVETVHEVMELAVTAGVQHVVDLAGGGWWQPIEDAVEDSGLAWTHLQPGEFTDNVLIWAEQIRTTGTVRDAYPDAANAPIAMDDIADVAARVLLEDGHAGQAYELTGPETLSRAGKVRAIGAGLGREIPYIEVSREEAIEQLTPVMGDYAAWYVDLQADIAAEPPQQPTPTVERLVGRPAASVEEWAARHRAEFT